jgi:hypothetical protein
MYCLSLIHAVSQAKCQKSCLLNSLVLQKLIINLLLHSRSTKIILNYSHIYWTITFKIIDLSGCKTDQPKPGPFSLTIQTRKQKALGTRLRCGVVVGSLWGRCGVVVRRCGSFHVLVTTTFVSYTVMCVFV